MSAKTGKKRASPGTDDIKNGDPLAEVSIGEEEDQKLTAAQKDVQRVELVLERRAQQSLTPVYQKRRETLKAIAKFWPVTLLKHSIVGFHAQHDADRIALSHLEDVWIVRDAQEPKVFTLEFYFKENPYFTDSVLKKEYKFEPQSKGSKDVDADGISDAMLDFSWERDVVPQATKISWKDESKKLTKLYPLVLDQEDAEQVVDPGSFFNFFEIAQDHLELGVIIANEIFPDAIDYFRGNAGGDELDSDDDEDSEDDDEDADEIDLEKPRAKKAKNA
ncbi:hypothetical protein FA95DRAFT_1553211 [Auriscalpium vulgare]|uniref:Uncharacterized protein n=1 Tax=Auriscalpium vulgare TaxID=40419 RepID=A0ACB8S938_9AGAM|nr:hypothetical protein FA95DRAFT_1553211 [Auriscalpium vulgare]